MINLVMIAPYPRDRSLIERGVEAVTVNLLDGLKRIRDVNIHVITFWGGVNRPETSIVDVLRLIFCRDSKDSVILASETPKDIEQDM